MNRVRRRPFPRPASRPAADRLESRAYLSAVMFAKVVSYPTGLDPDAVVAADLNGDGHADVATANFGDGTVSVLLGNGNGTFAASVPYAVGPSPQSLAVGDLTGHGHPDLVTANEGDGTVSVLVNSGDGTFAPAVSYAVGAKPAGMNPEAVALADLSGNGRLDIITANEGTATVSVLMNNGDGTFAPPVSYGAGGEVDALAVGDLNGDGRPDLVTVDPADDTVYVLLNKGDGTFGSAPVPYATDTTGRAAIISDTNNDGRPDIVVANLRSADLGVLTGNGDGTFTGQVTYKTGAFPFSVASADLNGDNRPDLITADNRDNAVGVLVHNGMGAYNNGGINDTPKQFATGPNSGPVAVAVADLNGDGKPDLIAADFNDNAIGVLVNQTVFPPLTPTSVTLTPAQNPVELGNRLTLTAQVTPAPSPALPAGRVVQFLAGDKVLGVAPLSAAGTATIATGGLPAGATSIVARYSGNSRYAGSVVAVNETVLTAGAATPLVASTAVALIGRAGSAAVPFVPGDTGTAAVTVTDQGAGRVAGSVGVALSLVPTAYPTAVPIPVAPVGRATFALSLIGGHSAVVPVRFAVPATLGGGTYTVMAALVPAGTLAASQVSPAVVATATAATVVVGFGTVGSHRGYALTTTLPGGATATLSLAGPGTGILAPPVGNAVNVTLSNTTAGSTFTITPGSGPVTIANLLDYSPLGGLSAPGVVLAGAINITDGTRRLTLAGAAGSTISIGPAFPSVLSLGTVAGTSLFASGPIQSLAVNNWTATAADAVTAVAIRGALTSGGDFGARLSLPATEARGKATIRLASALGSATIAGAVDSPTWLIGSNVGPVRAGGVAAGFSGSIAGTLASLGDAGSFAGVLAASTFGTVAIAGNLTDADLLAGASLGPAAQLGGGDDTFNAGRIASVQVGGSVVGSLVAAGIRPASDTPFTPVGGTLIRGGFIGPITVVGTVDTASRFAAAFLPARATVGGASVTTGGDPRFS